MIRGIYTAASGMIAETMRNDIIANNLANTDTAGYKKDIAINKDFASLLIKRINDGKDTPSIGNMGVGTVVDEVATVHSTGIMKHTGNQLDMAIDGNGYFVVDTPNGLRYTRNGTFSRNIQGELVTSEGYRVMGQAGPIRMNGKDVAVGDDGRISTDGLEAGQLRIVSFSNPKELLKEGNSLFAASQNAQQAPVTGRVCQGYLEGSNVNTIAEMVNLISGYRSYEVNAKTVQAQDQLLDKAVNDVGRT